MSEMKAGLTRRNTCTQQPLLAGCSDHRTAAKQSLERLFGGRPDLTTKAFHPSQLTTSDKAAIRALKSAIPEAHIIPIGGHSALIGFGTFYVEVDSEPGIRGRAAVPSRQADWGAHCMTNVLPYTIKQRS
jgi:hypothetical protein